jgi:hypothetical protein
MVFIFQVVTLSTCRSLPTVEEPGVYILRSERLERTERGLTTIGKDLDQVLVDEDAKFKLFALGQCERGGDCSHLQGLALSIHANPQTGIASLVAKHIDAELLRGRHVDLQLQLMKHLQGIAQPNRNAE